MQEVYSIIDVQRMLGSTLFREGFVFERFDSENVDRRCEGGGEIDEEEYAQDIREMAWCAREDAICNYPENPFRYVSRLQRDDKFSYWFEISCTMEGEAARHSVKRGFFCDAYGSPLWENTLDHWFDRLQSSGISVKPTPLPVDWMEEPWAEPLMGAYLLRRRHIWPTRAGKRNTKKTIQLWQEKIHCSLFNMRDLPQLDWLDEPWALPIAKAFANAELFAYSNFDGTIDVERTVNFWLKTATRSTILKHRGVLLKTDESWAQPIHDRVMETIMKASNVAIV